jgi:hypothetical protein
MLASTRRAVDRSDEEWFVLVARRLQSGTPLYRGVYYVTTPLAVWAMRAVGIVFGDNLGAERALEAACFTGSLLLGWVICRRCGVGRVGRIALGALLVTYASPIAMFGSVYSSMAVTASLGVLLVLLDWLDARSVHGRPLWGHLGSVGVLCAVAFDSKPSTGGVALAAALLIVAGAHRPRSASRAAWADLGRVAAGFAIVNVAVVLPILGARSFGAFVGDVFAGKSDYLAVMGGLFPGGSHVFDIVTGVDAPLGQLVARTDFVVPCVAVAVVGWVVARAVLRVDRVVGLKVAALVAFGLVGLGAAYPRLGPQHLTEAMPLLLIVPFAAWGLVARSERSGSSAAARRTARTVLVLTAGLVVAAATVVVWAGGPGPSDRALVRRDLATLQATTGGRVFIIHPAAAYYYVTGRLQDPTPFDYPTLSDFGPRGESGVIAMLRHRSVPWVCVRTPPPHALTAGGANPLGLEQFVRRTFVLTARLHLCDLYRDPRLHPAG